MPGQPDPLADVIDALQRFTVESDVFVDVFAREHGLGRSDMNAIMWISTADPAQPMTVSRLAGLIGLGAPATTALVDRLEAAGHVERTRDPADRRRVAVVMQEPARALAVAFFRPLRAHMAAAVDGVPAADLRRTAEILRLLTTAVTEAREP